MKRRQSPTTTHEVWKGRHTGGRICIAEFITKDGSIVNCIAGPDGSKLRPLSVDASDFQPAFFLVFPGEVVVEYSEGELTISQLTGLVGELWYDSGKHARAKIQVKTRTTDGWETRIPEKFLPVSKAVVAAAKGDTTRPVWASEELYQFK